MRYTLCALPDIRHTDPWVQLLLKEEAEKRAQQKAGWWCDWVPKKNKHEHHSKRD